MDNCRNWIVCQNKHLVNDLCLECECIFGRWRKRRRTYVKIYGKNEICPVCNKLAETLLYNMDNDNYMCQECFRKLYFGEF